MCYKGLINYTTGFPQIQDLRIAQQIGKGSHYKVMVDHSSSSLDFPIFSRSGIGGHSSIRGLIVRLAKSMEKVMVRGRFGRFGERRGSGLNVTCGGGLGADLGADFTSGSTSTCSTNANAKPSIPK